MNPADSHVSSILLSGQPLHLVIDHNRYPLILRCCIQTGEVVFYKDDSSEEVGWYDSNE